MAYGVKSPSLCSSPACSNILLKSFKHHQTCCGQPFPVCWPAHRSRPPPAALHGQSPRRRRPCQQCRHKVPTCMPRAEATPTCRWKNWLQNCTSSGPSVPDWHIPLLNTHRDYAVIQFFMYSEQCKTLFKQITNQSHILHRLLPAKHDAQLVIC